jgi:hypothetical protein
MELDALVQADAVFHHSRFIWMLQMDVALVRPRFLPWLTGSYVSNHFHARGLLITLMMEAARTSKTLVNFYQTTRHYSPENSQFILGFIKIEHLFQMLTHEKRRTDRQMEQRK